MSTQNRVEYGPQITALSAVAMNGAVATRTSAAIDVRDMEFLRVEWSYALSGAKATDKLTFTFTGSQDNGSTFKSIKKIASDDAVSDFAPVHTLTAGEDTADLSEGDLGAVHVVGLTHVKVIATHTDVAGTVGANDKLTVKVRASRE
jgi:hypothetical protein